MSGFLYGMTTLGFLMAALFFVRFWRRTGDVLFATFAVAFVLLALNQALLGIWGSPREDQSLFYIPRLAAFVLLIAAIISKNINGGTKLKS